MFKFGWVRVWAVLTGVLLFGTAVASAYYIWGTDACYKFWNVTVADNIKKEDRKLTRHIKSEATTKIFCGKTHFSVLLTLEGLAQRKAVTQVVFQWLEPSGWSLDKYDTLDFLDGSEIKTSEIINRVSSHVHKARLSSIIWYFVATIMVSAFTLVLGYGIAWIRRGFSK